MHVLLLLLASIFAFSSSSFWNLWIGLELYSFFLTPWLMEGEAKTSKVYIFFYFLMQFLASVSFLVSSLAFFNKLCLLVLFFSLLMKVSCFPFHTWFVSILPQISWGKILILTSLSKLIPLSMLTLFCPPQGVIWILILGLIPPLGGFSTPCLRSVMAYSSVGHSSWLVICACMNKTLSALYALSYLVPSLFLCATFMLESLTSMKSTLMAKTDQACIVISVLALSGLPPFLGFIPKLLVVQHLSLSGALMEAGVLGMLSILPIYFYFKTGMLTLGVNLCKEFSFYSLSSLLMTYILGVGIVAMLFLMLSFSLMKKTLTCRVKDVKALNNSGPNGTAQVETEIDNTIMKESSPFSEVMSPLAYGV